MGERSVAPASFQQIDLLRKISRVPESGRRYDGIILHQLDGDLNVLALFGAIEDLVERHPALRTTIKAEGPAPIQEIHAGPVLPVKLSQARGSSVFETAHKACATLLSAVEAASGAPLFRAEIIVLDDTHLLVLKVHHLITDGWSDVVMIRDLSELYRARVEERLPDLARLPLSYADFARRQHADWPMLRSRVVEYWMRQLEDYPGFLAWPRPAQTPDDPYECRIITRVLDAQTGLGVRLAARACRVPPFLVLIAATVTAIGDVTGRYDVLIGSNVANREALEKRDLIGFFTNTRLMRVRLTPAMNLDAATAIVREQWLAGDDFREAPIDQVVAELGLSHVIKIDALELPASLARSGRLELPGIVVSAPSFSSERLRDWRDLNITWIPSQESFLIKIRHRLAAVDQATATAIAERAVTILTQLAREESLV